MREFLRRNSPPGMDLTQEWRVFLIGNSFSVAVSFFAFLDQYIDARSRLFTQVGEKKMLIDGAMIVPFHHLFSIYFSGFLLTACILLGYIVYHYAYFRQGSMSIYLMKRLPRKSERHRRALTLPCLAVLATIGVAVAAILFYFIIYFLATPKACLPYAVLREFWR